MSRHRVKITFEDGTFLRLICPESGCEPPNICPECGSDVRDSEKSTREWCDQCEIAVEGECWIKGWFDNCTAEELLGGTIEVPFDAEGDDGGVTFTVIDEAWFLRSKLKREIERLRQVRAEHAKSEVGQACGVMADGLQAVLDSESSE